MTEEKEHDGQKKEPPKIKLGLEEELAHLDGDRSLEPAGDTPKSRTTKIDLSAAQPPPKAGTTRIDVSQAVPGTPKKATTRIDASQAEAPPPKRSTARIDVSTAKPPSGDTQMVSGKSETSKLDLSRAVPPPSSAPEAPTAAEPAESDLEETVIPSAAKLSTQRILLDDDVGEPPKPGLKTVAEVQAAKSQTSRIDLPGSVEEKDEDVLKRRTAPLTMGSSAAPTTVKKKPEEEGITQVRPRPTVEEGQAPQSSTLRLDLPQEPASSKPGQPKTIRIKRPDGTSSRKPLTIARAGSATADAAQPEPSLAAGSASFVVEQAGPGVVYTVLMVLSILVALVVIYALLGQTYALDLPFWGKL
jgi:hypothetical protein